MTLGTRDVSSVEAVDLKLGTAYRVRDALDSEGQQKNQDESDDNPETKSFFSEKTDWRLLYEKTPHTTKTQTLATAEIDHFVLQALSIKNDPAVLEVFVVYRSGKTEGPVFVRISREHAFKLNHHKRGTHLSVADIAPHPHLTVTIPEPLTSTALPHTETQTEATETVILPTGGFARAWTLVKRATQPETFLLYGAVVLLLLCVLLLILAI